MTDIFFFLQEPVREIQRLAEYLAVNISHDLAHAIAMETQFSAMKSFKENYASQVTNKYYKGNTDSIFREGQISSVAGLILESTFMILTAQLSFDHTHNNMGRGGVGGREMCV